VGRCRNYELTCPQLNDRPMKDMPNEGDAPDFGRGWERWASDKPSRAPPGTGV